MPLCSSRGSRRCRGLLGGKNKRQKNRPLTENCTCDWKGLVNRTNNTRLSPCNYGFHYTTVHLSLMLSLHLSLSLCIYAPTGSRTAHRERRAERETSCKQDIWQHLVFFFLVFCNLLKEMYASKQNVVNPLAWLLLFYFFFGLWGKNKTILESEQGKDTATKKCQRRF